MDVSKPWGAEEQPETVQPFPRDDGSKTNAVPGIRWRRTIVATVSLWCCVLAMVIAAYPFIADQVGAWQAARSFSEQQDAARNDAADADERIDEARTYNEVLAGHLPPEDALPYEQQLVGQADGSMCWIEIPRIGIKAPVYRGADDDELYAALSAGAAHIRGTSLPVGGESANTVITGHTGMRDTRMFDQLDMLQQGDVVILWTQGQPFAYEVAESELVTPDRSDVLDIRQGVDQCTLITCRNPESTEGFLPQGTYSHRLVVHANRTDWAPEQEPTSIEYLANPRTFLFAGALGLAGIALWLLPIVALGARHSWVLNRIVGTRAVSPETVRDAEGRREVICLHLGLWRRAQLECLGWKAKGTWKRVPGDPSRIRLELRPAKGKRRKAETPDWARFVLPEGPFEARSLDDELGLAVDGGLGILVFRRTDASDDHDD